VTVNDSEIGTEVVQRFRCFQELSDREAALAADDLSLVRLTKGEDLFRQGESGECMYLVVSGQVELRAKLPDGAERVLSTLDGGDIFGEMSFLVQGPHQVTAAAASDCELCRITYTDFRESLQEGEAWARKFLMTIAQTLASRLAEVDRELAGWADHAHEHDEPAKEARVAELERLRTRLLSEWAF
jgi:CRP-like cAMP-binding protein